MERGMTQELPNTLSELATMALDDVHALEQRPGEFTIDMQYYVSPDAFSGRCLVCAAGAVMVRRLGAPVNEWTSPLRFAPNIQRALFAIDWLRSGHVGHAFTELRSRSVTPSAMKSFEADYAAARELDRDMPDYSSEPERWHEEMQVLIDDLEEAGL